MTARVAYKNYRVLGWVLNQSIVSPATGTEKQVGAIMSTVGGREDGTRCTAWYGAM
jgi:hypothetical protein